MDDINKYETAPLIELEDFKCPEGAKGFFIRGFDNKKSYYASFQIEGKNESVTMINFFNE